jgi:hypothetical protein
MLKTALAGVLVLGAIGPSLVSAEERFESKPGLGSAAKDRMGADQGSDPPRQGGSIVDA